MKKINIHTQFLCILFFVTSYTFGQIKISDNIQESSIVKQLENKLYFVDFWATWCAPCITASKYLESMQRLNSNDFYVVSLSQESPDVVKRFIKKHKTDLAVAIDFDGQTFKSNNVSSLPYAVLFNANGEKLWEGHPANFKQALLDEFLKTNNQRILVKDMLMQEAYKKVKFETNEMKFNDLFQYTQLEDNLEGTFEVKKNKDIIELTGSLKNIIAYFLKAYVGQIEIDNTLNKYYNFKIKNNKEDSNLVLESILNSFKLQLITESRVGEVLEVNIESANFWDTNQIDWGTDNQYQYLISDSEIKADNVSFEEMIYKLSNIINMPIEEVSGLKDVSPHDWQIHFKYPEFMLSNLIDEYGIKAEKKIGKYKKFIIKKKTPN